MTRHVPEWRDGCRLHYHDTMSAYRCGCRCVKARNEYRLYLKRRREGRAAPRRVPAWGTQRRIQALSAIGYPLKFQAREIGWESGDLHSILAQRVATVGVATATAVSEMYERLCMTVGPAQKARNAARRKGWAPPLAWDDIDTDSAPAVAEVDGVLVDLVEIERVMSGQQSARTLSGESRKVVLSRLVALGLTDGEIGRRIGMTRDAVSQARRRCGIQSRVPSGRRELEAAA